MAKISNLLEKVVQNILFFLVGRIRWKWYHWK